MVINTCLHMQDSKRPIHSMHSSLIYLFMQTLTVCLLHVRYCSRPWAHSCEQNSQEALPSWSQYSSERRHNTHTQMVVQASTMEKHKARE